MDSSFAVVHKGSSFLEAIVNNYCAYIPSYHKTSSNTVIQSPVHPLDVIVIVILRERVKEGTGFVMTNLGTLRHEGIRFKHLVLGGTCENLGVEKAVLKQDA